MIITVKNADYSGCSIGILVPSELRTKLIAAYSEITEDEIQATANFLDAIGYFGRNAIYSKLKGLMLPCVSKNLSEAIYDFKREQASEIETTNLNFDTDSKQLNSSAATYYNIGSFDCIKLNTFAYSKTTKAANGMDDNGGSYAGVGTVGCYFGGDSKLSYAVINDSKAIVLVSASGDATTLVNTNVKIITDSGISTFGTEKTYNSKSRSSVGVAKAGNNNAQDALLGWAEGLTLEEGTILKNAMVEFVEAL